jgi:hypothetical protein
MYLLSPFSLCPLGDGSNGQEMGTWLVTREEGEAKCLTWLTLATRSWNFISKTLSDTAPHTLKAEFFLLLQSLLGSQSREDRGLCS